MWIDPNDPDHFIVGDDGGISHDVGRRRQLRLRGDAPDRPVLLGELRLRDAVQRLRRRAGQRLVVRSEPAEAGSGDERVLVHVLGRRRLLDGAASDRAEHHLRRVAGRQHPALGPQERDDDVAREADVAAALCDVRGLDPRHARRHDASRRRRTRRPRIAQFRSRQKADSAELDLRFNWETPYFLSPHNADVMYVGGNRVLKSTQRGDNLYPISPDLSKKNYAKIDTSMNKTGGITLDATGAETYGTVVALAESYVRPGFLAAGTDDGNILGDEERRRGVGADSGERGSPASRRATCT